MIHSLFQTLLIAASSALVIVLFGFFLGYFLSMHRNNQSLFVVSGLANLCFCAPSTLPCYLLVKNTVFMSVPSFWLIIIAHWWMNGLHCAVRLTDFFSATDQFQFSQFRLSPIAKMQIIMRGRLGHLILKQFVFYFLLCASSFVPIILLSSVGEHRTLSVYLYRLIINDYEIAKIAQVGGLMMGVVIFASYVLKSSQNSITQHVSTSRTHKNPNPFKKCLPWMVCFLFCVPFVDVISEFDIKALNGLGQHILFSLLTSTLVAGILVLGLNWMMIHGFEKVQKRFRWMGLIGGGLVGIPKILKLTLLSMLFPGLILKGFGFQLAIFLIASLAIYLGFTLLNLQKIYTNKTQTFFYQVITIKPNALTRLTFLITKIVPRQSLELFVLMTSMQLCSATTPIFLGLNELPHLGVTVYKALHNYDMHQATAGLSVQIILMGAFMIICPIIESLRKIKNARNQESSIRSWRSEFSV